MSSIGTDVLVDQLKRYFPKYDISLEHTGGGCMTIYVSDDQGPQLEPFVVIGPGTLNPSLFYWDEMYVGPETEGLEGASFPVTNLPDLVAAIKFWKHVLSVTDLSPKKEDPIELLRSRVKIAAEAAQEAFWAVISTHFPEAKTGDFSPEGTFAFDTALSKAVIEWLSWNTELEVRELNADSLMD